MCSLPNEVLILIGDTAAQPDEDEESFNTISNQYPEIYFQPLILTGMRIISVVGSREWGSFDINLKHYLAFLKKNQILIGCTNLL